MSTRQREIRTRLANAARFIEDARRIAGEDGVGERLEAAIVAALSELTEAETLNNERDP